MSSCHEVVCCGSVWEIKLVHHQSMHSLSYCKELELPSLTGTALGLDLIINWKAGTKAVMSLLTKNQLRMDEATGLLSPARVNFLQ